MKITVLQQNFVVGDVVGNARKIRAGYRAALRAGADLVVSSELALLGYPPLDLLQRDDVVRDQLVAVEALAGTTSSVPLVVGFAEPNPEPSGKALFNAAAVLAGGRVEAVRRKALLPIYDIFDERRYFEPYTEPQEPIAVNGHRLGLLICEDIWSGIELPEHRKLYGYDPVEALADELIDALVVINGSPYWGGKGDARLSLAADVARRLRAPVVYINQAGGNDELIFDGRSFAVAASGAPIAAAQPFAQKLLVVDLERGEPVRWASDSVSLADVEAALVLGLRDYVDKVAPFPGGAVLALSGGIDSAVVACLGVKALGADRVLAVGMPSRFSSQASLEDARARAGRQPRDRVPGGPDRRARPLVRVGARAGGRLVRPAAGDRGEHPIADPRHDRDGDRQPRGRIVLGTGNKSELAMGYCTLSATWQPASA